jgi:alpha-1,6-mannosyltransferase
VDLRDHAAIVIAFALVAAFAHLVLVRTVESRGVRVFGFVALAFALRLACAPLATGFSDDYHRYLWEGRVVAAGENPYRHAPNDAALVSLRDETTWPRVTHEAVPAAYPPLTLGAFALASLTPWPLAVLRVVFVLAELLACFLLARLLAARGLDPARALVFALSPLVILEYAGSFHFDSLAIAATVAAFLARARGRAFASYALLGIATLCKPYAIVLVPLLARSDAPAGSARVALLDLVRRSTGALAVVLAIVALGYAPFARDGSPFDGLTRYAAEWSFNAPFFPALRVALETLRDAAHDRGVAGWFVASSPDRVARAVLFGVFAVVAAAIAVSRLSRERAAAWTLAALLLASPTIQPWYLTWLLPFVAFEPRPSRSPLFLWVCLAPLGYHVLPGFVATGLWIESVPWRFAQYAPVLLWIAWRASSVSSDDGGGAGGSTTPRAGNSDASPTQ